MNCKDAIKCLYINTDGLSSIETAEAKEHLLGCMRCKAFLERDKGITNLLFEKAPIIKAPESLRKRVFREIEKPSYRMKFANMFRYSRKTTYTAAVSITVILLFVVARYIDENQEPLQIANEIAKHHINYLQSSNLIDISSSEAKEVESWFRHKVGFLVKVPELSGTKLIGGRLCGIFQKPVAVLVYKDQGQVLSLFVVDQPNLDISSMDMVDIDGKKLCRGYGKGVNLVLWKERGLVYALVCGMSEMELLRLASISTINTE
ncbi:MAG: hypothetical protein WBD99_04230 [Thermodesulfobacteriota bacterium]